MFDIHFKTNKGFTLIEGIMVIVIIAVLAVSGAWVMTYMMQSSVFIPNQMNTEMLGSDALDIMVEGDPGAKGLRFSRQITNVQNTEVTFINQNNQTIRYRLDVPTNRLYRSINAAAETLVPYYIVTGTSLSAPSNILFTYFDANDVVTANPLNVRRIAMTLTGQTGTGAFDEWQGQSQQTTSIAVKKFQ